MAARDMLGNIDRRQLLIGGGVGVGLLVAWGSGRAAMRRTCAPRRARPLFNAWLKIGTDGHVTVAVPQAELGQGVWTTLPQILADELGADWRTVAVEPAPLSPLYANRCSPGGGDDSGCPMLPARLGRSVAPRFADRAR